MKLGRFIKVIKVGILLNYCKTIRLIWVRITGLLEQITVDRKSSLLHDRKFGHLFQTIF